MELKEIIEYHMKKAGISSYRQLGLKMGLTSATTNSGNLLKGLHNPTYKRLTQIADACGIQVWELLKPPGSDGVDYKPESRPGKKVERILFEYSDGSCDRFVKDPEPFED